MYALHRFVVNFITSRAGVMLVLTLLHLPEAQTNWSVYKQVTLEWNNGE